MRTKSSDPMGQRLALIHGRLNEALDQFRPDEVAIEAIFKHKSAESALRLGQARGVALLVAAQHGYEAHSYNAMTVKRSVGAHGKADKTAMAKMVCMLLGQEVDGPADVTDALAIAITHCAHARSRSRGLVG